MLIALTTGVETGISRLKNGPNLGGYDHADKVNIMTGGAHFSFSRFEG